jgi:hypothetical protein
MTPPRNQHKSVEQNHTVASVERAIPLHLGTDKIRIHV